MIAKEKEGELNPQANVSAKAPAKRLLWSGIVLIALSLPFAFFAFNTPKNENFMIPFGLLLAVGVKRVVRGFMSS